MLRSNDVRLLVQAMIAAGLEPQGVLGPVLAEAAEGPHEDVAACLIDFVVAHTCVAPAVGEPKEMLGFVVTATVRLLRFVATQQGQDPLTHHRALLLASGNADDRTLPAAQTLLALALPTGDTQDEPLRSALLAYSGGAHAVIASLADVCFTAYIDAAGTVPAENLLGQLLDAALGIVHGMAQMACCPPLSIVQAYWEQLVLDDATG